MSEEEIDDRVVYLLNCIRAAILAAGRSNQDFDTRIFALAQAMQATKGIADVLELQVKSVDEIMQQAIEIATLEKMFNAEEYNGEEI